MKLQQLEYSKIGNSSRSNEVSQAHCFYYLYNTKDETIKYAINNDIVLNSPHMMQSNHKQYFTWIRTETNNTKTKKMILHRCDKLW